MDPRIFETIVRYSTDVLNLVADDMGIRINLSQIVDVVKMEASLIKIYKDYGHFLPVNESAGLFGIKMSDFMEMFTIVSYFNRKRAISLIIFS